MKKEEKKKVFEDNINNTNNLQIKYLYSIGTLLISIAILIMSIIFVTYSYLYNPPATYVWADENQRILEEIPLNQMHVSDEFIRQWIVEKVETMFTYNYLDYENHGANIQGFFTDEAYSTFIDSFYNSTDLQIALRIRGISRVLRVDPPVLEEEGSVSGSLARSYTTRMVQTITGANETIRRTYDIEIIIVREQFNDQIDGLNVFSIIRQRS